MTAPAIEATGTRSRRWMLPALITILTAEDAGEIDRHTWDFNEYEKLSAYCVDAAELERFRVRFGGEFTASVSAKKPADLHVRLETTVAEVPVMLSSIQDIPAGEPTGEVAAAAVEPICEAAP